MTKENFTGFTTVGLGTQGLRTLGAMVLSTTMGITAVGCSAPEGAKGAAKTNQVTPVAPELSAMNLYRKVSSDAFRATEGQAIRLADNVALVSGVQMGFRGRRGWNGSSDEGDLAAEMNKDTAHCIFSHHMQDQDMDKSVLGKKGTVMHTVDSICLKKPDTGVADNYLLTSTSVHPGDKSCSNTALGNVTAAFEVGEYYRDKIERQLKKLYGEKAGSEFNTLVFFETATESDCGLPNVQPAAVGRFNMDDYNAVGSSSTYIAHLGYQNDDLTKRYALATVEVQVPSPNDLQDEDLWPDGYYGVREMYIGGGITPQTLVSTVQPNLDISGSEPGYLFNKSNVLTAIGIADQPRRGEQFVVYPAPIDPILPSIQHAIACAEEASLELTKSVLARTYSGGEPHAAVTREVAWNFCVMSKTHQPLADNYAQRLLSR